MQIIEMKSKTKHHELYDELLGYILRSCYQHSLMTA